MKNILNLTIHKATQEQIEQGVVDLEDVSEVDVLLLADCIVFNEIPTLPDLYRRAYTLAGMADRLGYNMVMIGGAPFFMSILEKVLISVGVTPLYTFSKWITTDNQDGTKTSRFAHLGFYCP